ncbi:MAG: DUF3127 domain-containing protein [Bacteroidaceae bacterium]|nr:DUF3127 domain-containing protein [Bacteroidaceae bacterium]
MELTGKIIAVMPERGGVSQRTGTEWKVQEYVLETINEQFPRKLAFEVFGSDRIASFNIKTGETMTVSFDIDASEYNGRWYNRIRAWKVDRNVTSVQPAEGVAAAPASMAAPVPATSAAPAFTEPTPQAPGEGSVDDLPF